MAGDGGTQGAQKDGEGRRRGQWEMFLGEEIGTACKVGAWNEFAGVGAGLLERLCWLYDEPSWAPRDVFVGQLVIW